MSNLLKNPTFFIILQPNISKFFLNFTKNLVGEILLYNCPGVFLERGTVSKAGFWTKKFEKIPTVWKNFEYNYSIY